MQSTRAKTMKTQCKATFNIELYGNLGEDYGEEKDGFAKWFEEMGYPVHGVGAKADHEALHDMNEDP